MLEYPTITSASLLAAINKGRECQASKAKSYYHKMVGGSSCSNFEQRKITLLVYVLEQIYKLDMTCFDESPADEETLSYTQIFINHINVECKDCGFAFTPTYLSSVSTQALIDSGISGNDVDLPTPDEGDGVNNILLENGTYIDLEDESGNLLMES